MKWKTCAIIAISIFISVGASRAYAQDYVLPYPSYMPGNRLYIVSSFIDLVKKYWYFGDIGGMKYHRAISDKYLIEAMTLFEYKQYKLAVEALDRSDQHFSTAVIYMMDLSKSNIDDGLQKKLFKKQSEKHLKVFDTLSETLPKEIVWEEENSDVEKISIFQVLEKSKTIRNYAKR